MKNLFKKMPFGLSICSLSLLSIAVFLVILCIGLEEKTHFYNHDAVFLRIIFVLILALSLVLGFVINLVSRKRGLLPVNMKFDFSSFLSERFTLSLVSLGFLVNTFFEIYSYLNPHPTLSITGTANTFSLLTALFSAASLIYFIFFAFLIENRKAAASVLIIIPVIYVSLRILRDFSSADVIYFVPQNLFNIIYLCALLITLFSFCRLISESDSPKGFRTFSIFSPITIVLGFTLSVPYIIGAFLVPNIVSFSNLIGSFVDLTLSVFLLRFSMHLYKEI